MLVSAAEDGNRNNPFFADLLGSGTATFDPGTRSYDTTGFSAALDPATIDTSFRTKTVERTLRCRT